MALKLSAAEFARLFPAQAAEQAAHAPTVTLPTTKPIADAPQEPAAAQSLVSACAYLRAQRPAHTGILASGIWWLDDAGCLRAAYCDDAALVVGEDIRDGQPARLLAFQSMTIDELTLALNERG